MSAERFLRAGGPTLKVAALVVAFHACGLVEDTCACTRVAPHARIQGRVLDDAGVRVPRALIEVWVRDLECAAAASLQSRADANVDGEYVAHVTSFGAADRVCVDLLAIDTRATPLDSAWATDIILPIAGDSIAVLERDIRF